MIIEYFRLFPLPYLPSNRRQTASVPSCFRAVAGSSVVHHEVVHAVKPPKRAKVRAAMTEVGHETLSRTLHLLLLDGPALLRWRGFADPTIGHSYTRTVSKKPFDR